LERANQGRVDLVRERRQWRRRPHVHGVLEGNAARRDARCNPEVHEGHGKVPEPSRLGPSGSLSTPQLRRWSAASWGMSRANTTLARNPTRMRPQRPVLHIYIGRDGDAWRLYVAGNSWTPNLLRNRMDERREIYPIAQPDVDNLDRLMRDGDSPFLRRTIPKDGLEVLAKGRSAVTLLVWLEGIMQSPTL